MSSARHLKAASSSVRAYIRVSGTYLPPNFPNRPKESGRSRASASAATSSLSTAVAAILATTERVGGERELDWLYGVVLRNLAGGSEGERKCKGRWDWVLQAVGAEEEDENAILDFRQVIVRKGKL